MAEGDIGIGLEEAAARLGVHYMTVYRYVRTGRLAARRQGGRWLVDPTQLAPATRSVTPTRPRRPVSGGSNWGDRVNRLKARMLAGDVPGTWTIVDEGLLSGTPSDIYLKLLAPALAGIGEAWQRGDLTVGDEHLATTVALAIVGRVGPLFTRRGPARPGRVLLAGGEGDPHMIPLTMVSDALRGDGWDVVHLGADVPGDDLIAASRSMADLRAVGISISADRNLPRTGRNIRALAAARPEVPVLLGGPAIRSEETALELGATAWAVDLTGTGALLTELERK